MHIHLHIFYDCFHVAMAEMSSWHRLLQSYRIKFMSFGRTSKALCHCRLPASPHLPGFFCLLCS